MSEQTSQRQEPRFPLGARLLILLKRGREWEETPANTVNVSENGLLVTMRRTPQVRERVRVKTPDGEFTGEAVVRHVIPGKMNCLVGMRLVKRQGRWLAP
jgi:hypothetical protein